MPIEVRELQVVRHADADTHREMVSRLPHARLAGYVLGYTGYVEQTRLTMRRREVPFAGVPLIISFGPTIRVAGSGASPDWSQYRSFVAGLDDRFARTEYSGAQHGLQVNFTPLGAYRFFGVSMRALANRVLHLDDVLGAQGHGIVSQVAETPTWEERFALLDRLITSRMEANREPSTGVAWAWRRIQAAGGNFDIGTLTRELGCSRKHLIARFHDEIGLPPKLVARIQRFHRVRRLGVQPANWRKSRLRCAWS